tara:strand:- start:372 stop:557 length:186 start_codon:yes stop_codon:yes gene_type:complete
MLEKNKLQSDFIANSKAVVSPLIEIVHFDTHNKENKKESYPVSHYLDSECHNLRNLNSIIN